MNLAFLCLWIMGKRQIILLYVLLVLGFTACTDDAQEFAEPVDIAEPLDDLVRLENIRVADAPEAAAISTVDIVYNSNQLITDILFTGNLNANFEMSYTANNRLIRIDRTEASLTAVSSLEYLNNTILFTTTFPDGSREQKELRIDLQNRIDRAITYSLDNAGNRTENKRLQYLYTQNFNVSRINELASNGNTVLGYTEFTYEFNNNPFRDMNDVLRFIVFADFIPYTRYLPVTQRDFERVGGNFVESRSVIYSYTLQDDQFPSSRVVETTVGASTQTTYEFFEYEP